MGDVAVNVNLVTSTVAVDLRSACIGVQQGSVLVESYNDIVVQVSAQPAVEIAVALGGPPGPAAVNPVISVNGQTGIVVLTHGSVGADPAGSAAAALVSALTALAGHTSNLNNPHQTTAAQVGADPAGTAAAAIAAHLSAPNPHPSYREVFVVPVPSSLPNIDHAAIGFTPVDGTPGLYVQLVNVP